MGEEGTEHRLTHAENNIKDVKSDIKEVKVEIKDMNTSIVKIEKTDIRIEIDIKSILDTYQIIRNTAIGFVVLNILTMLWTLSKYIDGGM